MDTGLRNTDIEVPKTNFDSKAERAIEISEEALSGYSPKSKNELIKDAIRVLK